jgi:hypothetical protein
MCAGALACSVPERPRHSRDAADLITTDGRATLTDP